MKKVLFFLLFILAGNFVVLSASNCKVLKKPINTVSGNYSQDDVNNMVNRLEEINKLDKSSLTAGEKHVLRSEVLNIRNRLVGAGTAGGPYVYIGGGTLILIIILLIILL